MIDYYNGCTDCFNIWSDGSDREWARKVWEALVKEGFVEQKENDVSDARDSVILITLADLLYSFSDQCFEAGAPPPLIQMAYDLKEPIDIKALTLLATKADSETDWVEQFDEEDETFFDSALFAVSISLRGEIVSELKGIFGGDQGLFMSMYKLSRDDDDDDYDPMMDPTALNCRGYAYVDQGMPNCY